MFVRAAGVQGTESGGVPGQFKCLSQLLEFKRVLELEQYQDRVSKYWFYYTVNVISVHKYIVILSYLAKSC